MPYYVGADSMVIDGGFATMGVNYEELGKATADMAKSIYEGTPVSELPVVSITECDPYINVEVADKLGIATVSYTHLDVYKRQLYQHYRYLAN